MSNRRTDENSFYFSDDMSKKNELTYLFFPYKNPRRKFIEPRKIQKLMIHIFKSKHLKIVNDNLLRDRIRREANIEF
jgi:hypothetical protein